jgi:hypothetical protein
MMCARVQRQFAQCGIDAVLYRKQRAAPPVSPIFDGEKEAKLIALAFSQPLKAGRNGRFACWNAKSSEETPSFANALGNIDCRRDGVSMVRKMAPIGSDHPIAPRLENINLRHLSVWSWLGYERPRSDWWQTA